MSSPYPQHSQPTGPGHPQPGQPAGPHTTWQPRPDAGSAQPHGVHALPQAASPVAHSTYVPAAAAAPAVHGTSSTPWRTILMWAVGVIGIITLMFGVFMVIGVLTLSYGGVGAMIALGVSIPAACSLLVIVLIILVADRWDPQPIPLLIMAVAWGGGVATTVSIVVNSVVGSIFGDVIGSVISAPFIEETSKGAGLIVALVLARRYFTGPLDGLVYGALIGGGFAFVENILYYTNGTVAGWANSGGSFGAGVTGLIFTVIIRGVIGIFGHVGYTSLTGVIMGYVARRWGVLPGVVSFVVAVIPGMFLHAAWNGSASLDLGFGFFLLMLCIEMFFGFLWIGLVFLLMFEESRFMRQRLLEYQAAGWFTPDEVQMLATWGGRRHGKRWAKSIGQKDRLKQFIRDATELSHTRQVIRADGPKPKTVASERQLLETTGEHRRALQAAVAGPAGR